MRPMTRILALIFCIAALLPGHLFAQGQLGVLTGSVLDPSGAVVPDVTITVTEMQRGVKWEVKTTTAGYYRLPVPPGTYRLEAKKQGFKAGVAENIVVPVAQVVNIDFSLQVGGVTEAITVSSEAPLLTSASAEVGSTVTAQEFETLPIAVDDGGRQLQTFIFTSLPGTVGDAFEGSINGGQLFSSEILIDGVSIARYDLNGGSLVEFSPSTDAIGEFKVQMSNYSAEYGETGGGIANFVMKSGTNEFHGTAYDYLKNPVFNAAGLTFGAPKHNIKENDFGAAVGGPIKKDKTFFFAAYEGDRFRSFQFSSLMTLPTPLMRTGNFSEWLTDDPALKSVTDFNGTLCSVGSLCQVGTDALGRPVYYNEVYDPTTTRVLGGGQVVRDGFGFDATTGLPIAGMANVIPAGDFSNASSVLLPLFPNPQFSGILRNTPRYSGCCPILNRDAESIKIDHSISTSQKFIGSFGFNRRDRFNRNGATFPPFPSQPLSPYKEQIVGGPQLRLSHEWTLNNHTINIAALGFNRFANSNNVTNDAKYTPLLGIPGIPNDCFPPFHFSGHATGGKLPSTLGAGCHNSDPSESYIYQDTLSYLRGRHSLKFGGEFRRYRYNTFEPGPVSGDFRFNDRETSLPGFTKLTGNPFASFVMGAVHSGGRSIYLTEPGYRAGFWAFFVQDDFKATPKLTLNLGLRWEIPLPKKEAFNRQSGFDPTVANPGADGIPGALVFLGTCSTCINRTSFQDAYFKEVGPRLGVAYAASNKLVFRGGYGISYSPPILNNFGSQNLFGFNSGIPLFAGTAPTGFFVDPVVYWSPIAGPNTLPASYVTGNGIGVPAFTGTLPNRDPASANGQGIDFLPKNSLAQPYSQNWSAGFQYQVPHAILFEANYVGAKGSRLLNSYFAPWYNQAPSKYMGLGDILADPLAADLADPVNGPILASYGITQVPYASFDTNNYSNLVGAAVQPFPQYSGLLNNFPTIGTSTYHSLQVTGTKRSATGLTFIAAYTFSKTLTNADTALYYPSATLVQDFYNQKLEKSVASFNFPQFLKLTWIYQLPFGKGRKWLNSSGKFDRFASGWQVTAIQNYSSGDPLEIITEQAAGIASPGIRADVIPGVSQKGSLQGFDESNGRPYLNPAAFGDPPLSPNNGFALRIGTGPRFLPNIRGPAHHGEDFGIIKDTQINERFRLQFRADMFNVFNRTGAGDPDTDLDGGTFGLIFGPDHGPRIIQMALRLKF